MNPQRKSTFQNVRGGGFWLQPRNNLYFRCKFPRCTFIFHPRDVLFKSNLHAFRWFDTAYFPWHCSKLKSHDYSAKAPIPGSSRWWRWRKSIGIMVGWSQISFLLWLFGRVTYRNYTIGETENFGYFRNQKKTNKNLAPKMQTKQFNICYPQSKSKTAAIKE